MTRLTGSPRRQVFDFERWREHRNVDRYTRHMVGILQCATSEDSVPEHALDCSTRTLCLASGAQQHISQHGQPAGAFAIDRARPCVWEFRSRIVRGLARPLLAVGALSLAVCSYEAAQVPPSPNCD